MEREQGFRRERAPASRLWRFGLGLLVLIIVALGGYALVKGLRVRASLVSALQSLQRIEAMSQGDSLALLQTQGFAPLQAEFRSLGESLRALEREIGGDLALLSHLGGLPKIGPTLAAAPHLLRLAIELASAGEAACQGGQPVLEALLGSNSGPDSDEVGERILGALVAGQSSWAGAYQAVERAAAARARFAATGLHPRVGALVARLDKYFPWLRAGIIGVLIAPEFMGRSSQRNYLIIAQNSDELRATGGFISGVGLLVLQGGKIAELSFMDSYLVDDYQHKPYPGAPKAMFQQMGIELWLFRDANWFPHFPTSAQACAALFYLGQELEVDGVIAADLTVLQRLVGAVAPLRIERYDTEVTGDNVLALIRESWAPPLREGESWEDWKKWESVPWQQRPAEWRAWFLQRKDFMPDLVNALMQRILSGPASAETEFPVDTAKLLFTIKGLLDEKHILIYFRDPQAQRLVHELGWDGALVNPEHDYLAVVDSNVGYNKANPNIKERIVYEVSLHREGDARGRVTLSYENTSTRPITECIKGATYDPTYELMTQRCYWDYVRVYAPQGATLLQAQSPQAAEVLDEGTGHRVWATSFVTAPGEKAQLVFEYQLPEAILRRDGVFVYNLLVQKQAGTEAIPLYVNVRLPEGAKLIQAEPHPFNAEGGLVRFYLPLQTDRRLHLSFQP